MSARKFWSRFHGVWLLGLLCLCHAAAAQTIYYVHTDALGSIVAESDSAGQVVSRREYEPYGQQLAPTVQDGPGYTGHVQDAATGLTYMQQRYYDPGIGRFLSADPVTAHSSPVAMFNRYQYAKNNPYRFTDPDGRESADRVYGAAVAYMLRNDPDKLRIWAGGEAAATTEGSIAEQGAAMGLAAGEFVDTGDYSGAAVAGAAANAMVGVVTKGRYTPSGRFSRSTKRFAADRAERKCEYCGVDTVQAKRSERGVTPPKNEGVTDHIEPRSRGGDNSPDNAAHACRECNGRFSDAPKPHPRDETRR
ncbi:RHS repeat-associated core domain-containing protein [Luteimonas sp. gir]|uniref:RHS repeat-associated core domain-containing protein n=1 Tax=Luteimonas sp. gir TaxID=3127960 RepID=UPI003075C6D5